MAPSKTESAVKCGTDLGHNADKANHHLEQGAIERFHKELSQVEKTDNKSHGLAAIATRKATETLTHDGILPATVIVGAEHNSTERCTVAGTTADPTSSGKQDLVIAVGKDANGRAKHVFTMDENGNYYTATEDSAGHFHRGSTRIGDEKQFEAYCKKESLDQKSLGSGDSTTTAGDQGSGIKITVRKNEQGPAEVDVTREHGGTAHYKKVDGVWQSQGDRPSKPIKDVTVDAKNQPTIVYEDGSSRTVLSDGRTVNEDMRHRVTSVMKPDGRSITFKYANPFGNEIESYDVTQDDGTTVTFKRHPNDSVYTVNGAGVSHHWYTTGESYYTNAPVIDASTGSVQITSNRGTASY